MQRLDPSSSVGIPLPLPPQAASARPVEVPTWKKIDQAVKTAPLFAYVKNKMNIISPLCAMSHPAIPAEVERIVHLMNNGPMTILDLPFRNPQFEELMLIAYTTGKITVEQLGSALYWKEGFAHYGRLNPITEVPLFLADGSLDPRVHAHFIQYNTEEEIKAMAEEWRRAPVSEQRFLFAETSNTIFDSLCFGRSSRSRTILDATYELETERPAGRRFNRYIHPDGDKNLIYRMMPSLTLVQVACKQLGGHVTPVIRLGASASLRQNGLRGERDISLRSKFVETPETADGNKAPYEEFTGHDFYHVQILSTIPKELQRASIGVADRLRELGYTKDADFLEDMEFNFPSNCTSDQDRLDFISSLLSQKRVYRKDPYELPPIIQTLLLDLFPKLKVGSEPSGATAPPDGK